MSSPTDEIDALFKLPLGEFTSARNALAAKLKKSGRKVEAEAASALAKPSISAWVVNQLYWRHRGLFDKLVEAGDRMRRKQAGQGDAGREAATTRRETITALGKLAEGLLLGGEHGATRDVLRRVTTTLDALSSYGSLPNAPPAGRLADDVEPPGFEALVGMPAGGKKRPAPAASKRAASAAAAQNAARAEQRAAQRAEAERKEALAAAKTAMHDAERALKSARRQAEHTAAQLEAATARAKALDAESKEATAAVATAERALQSARRQLQLFS